jgi:hypothetical protein
MTTGKTRHTTLAALFGLSLPALPVMAHRQDGIRRTCRRNRFPRPAVAPRNGFAFSNGRYRQPAEPSGHGPHDSTQSTPAP